jgi:hypothetical protein
LNFSCCLGAVCCMTHIWERYTHLSLKFEIPRRREDRGNYSGHRHRQDDMRDKGYGIPTANSRIAILGFRHSVGQFLRNPDQHNRARASSRGTRAKCRWRSFRRLHYSDANLAADHPAAGVRRPLSVMIFLIFMTQTSQCQR